MTDRPRDLAAEVNGIDLADEHRRIRRDHDQWYHENRMYDVPQFEWQTHQVSIHRLLEYITALSRKLEEHREALRWALDNDAGHCIEGFTSSGGECCITLVDPPAHLAPILAEAMRSKP